MKKFYLDSISTLFTTLFSILFNSIYSIHSIREVYLLYSQLYSHIFNSIYSIQHFLHITAFFVQVELSIDFTQIVTAICLIISQRLQNVQRVQKMIVHHPNMTGKKFGVISNSNRRSPEISHTSQTFQKSSFHPK